MLRIFVDDMRTSPDGWHLVRTITEAVRILSGPIPVSVVSLDHDIVFEKNNKLDFSGETFATVARYIALLPKERLPKVVYFHTANWRGAEDMEAILKDIVPTVIVPGSYDLDRFDYKEKLIELEEEREAKEKCKKALQDLSEYDQELGI